MKLPTAMRILTGILCAALVACGGKNDDPLKGTLTGSPLNDLPSHIKMLTDYGSRAAWSPAGNEIIFLDDMIADVHRVDIHTGEVSVLTDHYDHYGYTRAHYLVNGDIVLCGPEYRDPDAQDPEAGRFNGVLWVLELPFDQPAVSLGEPCWEGIAVSGKDMKIAWSRSNVHFGEPGYIIKFLTGYSEMWMGDIKRVDGLPRLINKRKILKRRQVARFSLLEVQDFRPPDEKELIFSTYVYGAGEVMGLNLETGEVTNYSKSFPYYEEAEGIFPDGNFTTVERDLAFQIVPEGLDIWKLSLDQSNSFERLTYFDYYQGFGASNPVIRSDGKYMAFQLKDATKPVGNGNGILLFDLDAFNE